MVVQDLWLIDLLIPLILFSFPSQRTVVPVILLCSEFRVPMTVFVLASVFQAVGVTGGELRRRLGMSPSSFQIFIVSSCSSDPLLHMIVFCLCFGSPVSVGEK